jgi:hypothetical protein
MIVQVSTIEDNLKLYSGVTGSNSLIEDDNFEYGMPSLDILINNKNIGFSGKTYQSFNIDNWGYYLSTWLDDGAGSALFNLNGSEFNLPASPISSIGDLLDWLNSLSIGDFYYTELLGGQKILIDSDSAFTTLYMEQINADVDPITNVLYNTINFESNRSFDQDPFIDISKAYIIDSDFKSGLFKDSEWVTGNYINYNRDYSLETDIDGYYINSGITSSTATASITLNVGDEDRYNIFEVGDSAFLNGVYLDANLLNSPSDDLLKIPSRLTLDSINESINGRHFTLIDNTVSSPLISVGEDFYDENWLLTPETENKYNYLSPVRFENSKIISGIFRRAYFINCEFNNPRFNSNDKDIKDPLNKRELLVSDTIFNNNGNTIRNGIFANSIFLSGNDKFLGGIVYNSIWDGVGFDYKESLQSNGLTYPNLIFEGGVFTKSKWLDGQFNNGLFYNNRTNNLFSRYLYGDTNASYYSRNFLTRYAWLDGTFNKGTFEQSNWESGTFNNGEFFYSNFIFGEVFGGVFGRENLKSSSTRVISGSFSNAIVINAEFRSTNPQEIPVDPTDLNGNLLINATPIFIIEWYSGKFNGGVFGVDVKDYHYDELGFNYPYKSIWYDGEFNGGKFTDIAKWKNGKFNGGKFTSYYGYPEVKYPYQYYSGTYSTPESFAWEYGEFNGGEFGNLSTGTNSTWFNGELNGGMFAGRYWRTGVLYRGKFLGSGQGKSTMKDSVSQYISEFSENFFGYWRDGVVTENKDDYIINKKFYTELERDSSRTSSRRNVSMEGILWRGGIFSHNDAYFINSIWMDGVFKKGNFVKSSFNPYINYLSNGNFDDNLIGWSVSRGDTSVQSQISYPGLISYSIVNTSGSNLNWTGMSNVTVIYQITNLNPGDIYSLRIRANEPTGIPIVRYGNWVSPINGNFINSNGWELTEGMSADITISTGTINPGYIEVTIEPSDPCLAIYREAFAPEFIGATVSVTIHWLDNTNPGELSIEVFADDSITNVLGVIIPSTEIGRSTFDIVPDGPDFILRIASETLSGGIIRLNGIIVTGNTIFELSDTDPYPQEIRVEFQSLNQFFGLEFVSDSNSALANEWDISSVSIDVLELTNITGGFNNNDTCIWENGTLNDSEFFVSKWENGNWIYGTGYGMIWKNGIANYMNANNIYWEGGVWKNGNWNGAPFDANSILSGSTSVIPGFTFEILQNIANYRDSIDDPEYTSIFINNAFIPSSGDPNLIDDPEIDLTGLGIERPEGTINANPVSISPTSSVVINSDSGDGFDWVYTNFYTEWDGTSELNNMLSPQTGGGYLISESSIPNKGVVVPEPINYTDLSVNPNRYPEFSGYFMPFPVDYKGRRTTGSNFLAFSGNISNLSWYNTTVSNNISPQNIIFDESNSFSLGTYTCKSAGYYQLKLTGLYGHDSHEEYHCRWHQGGSGINKALIGLRCFFLKNGTNISTQDIDYSPHDMGGSGTERSFNFSLLVEAELGDNFSIRIALRSRKICSGSNNCCNNGDPYLSGFVRNKDLTINITRQYGIGLLGSSGDPYLLPLDQQISKKLFLRGSTQSGLYVTEILEEGFTYNIEISYSCSYGMKKNSPTAKVDFLVRAGTLSQDPIEDVVTGGFSRMVTENMDGIIVTPNTNGLGQVENGSNYYVGTTGLKTVYYTVTPRNLSDTDDDRKRISIQRLGTSDSYTRLNILKVQVIQTSSPYDYNYINATYSGISEDIQSINLPPIGLIGGSDVNGNQISVSFGNGIFKSGNFSSIWENGVWNQGLRFDKEVIYFSNLKFFTNTSKPLSFSGKVSNSGSNDQSFYNNTTNNQLYTESVVSYKSSVWILTLEMSRISITTESTIPGGTFTSNQQGSFNLNERFKVGDRVAVGNIVMIDINNRRRLVRDYLTIIGINDVDKTIVLQLEVNFPINLIQRDSENHLIFVTKNIWLNGAYLNGTFRGVWNNGLFRGYPFITRMLDSQWVDGTLNGGRFRGLTSSISYQFDIQSSSINSGLVQNFNFFDRDQSILPYLHEYQSWMDVNYYKNSTVTIGRNTTTYDEGVLFSPFGVTSPLGEYTETDYYSYPSYDILSSVSTIRNNYNSKSIKYSLGYKYLDYVSYLGNIKEFDNYYNTRIINGEQNLIIDGFTWSGRVPSPNEDIFYSDFEIGQVNFKSVDSTSNITLLVQNQYKTITFPDILYNESGSYNATNSRYRPFLSGTYTFECSIEHQTVSFPCVAIIEFVRYSSQQTVLATYPYQFTSTPSIQTSTFSSTMYLNAGEYVAVRSKKVSLGTQLVLLQYREFYTTSIPELNIQRDNRGPVRLFSNTNDLNDNRLEINFDPDIVQYLINPDSTQDANDLFHAIALDSIKTYLLPNNRYNYISFDLEGQIVGTSSENILNANKSLLTFNYPTNSPVEVETNNILRRVSDMNQINTNSIFKLSKTSIKEYFYNKRKLNLLTFGKTFGKGNQDEKIEWVFDNYQDTQWTNLTTNPSNPGFSGNPHGLVTGDHVDVFVGTFSNIGSASLSLLNNNFRVINTPDVYTLTIDLLYPVRWPEPSPGPTASGTASYSPKTKIYISNLSFTETDMVPFFQMVRTDEENINEMGIPNDIDKSIQTPLVGVAPFIDTSNPNFSFIDNINFGGSIFTPYTPTLTSTPTTPTSVSGGFVIISSRG